MWGSAAPYAGSGQGRAFPLALLQPASFKLAFLDPQVAGEPQFVALPVIG